MSKIDQISEWTGKLASWLVLVLMCAITYEVIMRYLFRAPTVWSYDLSYMIGGSLMALGGAYVLKNKGHVRVDILYLRFSPRRQIVLDIVFTVLLFFPMMIVLLYYSIDHAWFSWVTSECSNIGHWHPPMFPFRAICPVAIFLLLLQGVSWLTSNICSLKRSIKQC